MSEAMAIPGRDQRVSRILQARRHEEDTQEWTRRAKAEEMAGNTGKATICWAHARLSRKRAHACRDMTDQ